MAHQGGLQGKARRVYHERRASRLYAHQLIDEYFEPEDRPARPQRFIPVRSRAEFLPSIATASEEPVALSLGTQLELPLVARVAEPRLRDAARANPRRLSADNEPRVLRFPTSNHPAATSMESVQGANDVKARAASKRSTSFKPWHAPRPRPFSVRGFLSGCALGSAAAMIALVFLRAIIG